MEQLFLFCLEFAEDRNGSTHKVFEEEDETFQWFLKSAEEEDNDGKNYLEYCYRNGIGTAKDEERAFQCYYHGVETTRDEEKAFQWYLKSAKVLRYMKDGNLLNFLQQNKSLPWKERVWLMNSFIRGLKIIHSHTHDNLKFIRLGDLGLCRPVDLILSSKTYGVLPYVAPEVYTQASDICSVGIIMWVISTRKIRFEEDLYDPELAIAIFNGYRPKIHKGTTQCWHNNPSECPSAEKSFVMLEKWIIYLNCIEKSEFSNSDHESLDYLKNALTFLNADQEMQNIDSESLCKEITWSSTHRISKHHS
ncbi:hypothetical protein Glove_641g14 [Diversispora epigaea]|uniref:Protein kinase domain-containing protein n=1 Tax=Diversispora epigaea TaxID=1348612 RepID=A0A397G995_9GLOM|nr:hypothetical protein Glove_641g14 [Diversispora epigaea]